MSLGRLLRVAHPEESEPVSLQNSSSHPATFLVCPLNPSFASGTRLHGCRTAFTNEQVKEAFKQHKLAIDEVGTVLNELSKQSEENGTLVDVSPAATTVASEILAQSMMKLTDTMGTVKKMLKLNANESSNSATVAAQAGGSVAVNSGQSGQAAQIVVALPPVKQGTQDRPAGPTIVKLAMPGDNVGVQLNRNDTDTLKQVDDLMDRADKLQRRLLELPEPANIQVAVALPAASPMAMPLVPMLPPPLCSLCDDALPGCVPKPAAVSWASVRKRSGSFLECSAPLAVR